jgi:hypothetical protein
MRFNLSLRKFKETLWYAKSTLTQTLKKMTATLQRLGAVKRLNWKSIGNMYLVKIKRTTIRSTDLRWLNRIPEPRKVRSLMLPKLLKCKERRPLDAVDFGTERDSTFRRLLLIELSSC